LTLGADLLCRTLPVMGELKLGVVTALLGAPFLLFLLWRERGPEA
jgi:iron complex transport system permease protein